MPERSNGIYVGTADGAVNRIYVGTADGAVNRIYIGIRRSSQWHLYRHRRRRVCMCRYSQWTPRRELSYGAVAHTQHMSAHVSVHTGTCAARTNRDLLAEEPWSRHAEHRCSGKKVQQRIDWLVIHLESKAIADAYKLIRRVGSAVRTVNIHGWRRYTIV